VGRLLPAATQAHLHSKGAAKKRWLRVAIEPQRAWAAKRALAAQARRYVISGVGGTVARGATTGAVRVSGAAWGAADATIMACRRMACRR
jgi:hypothetical protein